MIVIPTQHPTRAFCISTGEPFNGDHSLFWGYNNIGGGVVEPGEAAIWHGLEVDYLGRIEHYMRGVPTAGGQFHTFYFMDVSRDTMDDAAWSFVGKRFKVYDDASWQGQTNPFFSINTAEGKSYIAGNFGFGAADESLLTERMVMLNGDYLASRSGQDHAVVKKIIGLGNSLGGDAIEIGADGTASRFFANTYHYAGPATADEPVVDSPLARFWSSYWCEESGKAVAESVDIRQRRTGPNAGEYVLEFIGNNGKPMLVLEPQP